jgi:hypothetical protein
MMSLIADDNTLLKDVRLFIEPVEVYDAAGKLLGLFVPANLERCKERQAEILAKVDWAEIDRRAKSGERGVPFDHTLARLKQEMERRKKGGEKEWSQEEALAYYHSIELVTYS